MRPVALSGGHRVVPLVGGDGEDGRVGADLVERGEPGPAVERAVLDALGHHHAGRLLEAERRRLLRVREDREEDVEGAGQVGPVLAGQRERLVEVLAAAGQVGAVDREAGDQLADRVLGVGGGVGDRDPQLAADAQHLRAQDPVGDGALVVVHHRGPVDRPAAQPVVEGAERLGGGRVGEHPVDERHGVVAGGAGRGPRRGQLLAGLEDLLDQDVGVAGQVGEVAEVALGVAQAVGVVDAETVDHALAEPAADLVVRAVEPLAVLDADRGEGVDGEEAAVVEAGVGQPPGHELVVLAGVHVVGGGPRSSMSSALPGASGKALSW